MIKIVHIGDIHIFNDKRHEEYRKVFEKLYKYVEDNNIDVVLIGGDLFDNFIDIYHEAKLLAADLLNNLSKYSYIVLTVGNHDMRKKNLSRVNSVKTIYELINNPRISYLGHSDFFEDIYYKDIVWVNHSHLEKTINPWVDIKHKRDKSKIYIDLFHDPILGSSNDIGYTFDKPELRSIKDFKGDILMANDIHKRQILSTNKAYSGSLIQNNHGETIRNHGGILWKIDGKNITYEFFDIDNDEHSFITFRTQPNIDYNNINITPIEYINTKNVDVRLIWNDFSSNDTKENEYKLKKYIYDNYSNINSINIEKDIIYTNIIEGKMLSETIDINDPDIQKETIIEYLNVNNYDQNVIDEILDIDNIINDRLTIQKKINITWNIERMWFNNFKSYGDNIVIDWSKLNGIIQIMGINQQGKSTILDVICYILYGTTISTQKKEKFGDNRYINTIRKIDYCDGGMVINVNDEKYTIYRMTERKIKNDDLKGCTTKLIYYKGENIDDNNILTDEDKVKTQKLLDNILGNFEDFVRLSLTNADNLNETLSIDRSVFMDSFIRDAGLDVFDLKLTEFKEYKKLLNLEKIVLDIEEETNKIIEYEKDIKINSDMLKQIEYDINKNNENIKQLHKDKEHLISTLKKVNEEYKNIIIDDIYKDKNKIENDIRINENILNDIEKQIINLPDNFDYIMYDKVNNKLIDISNTYSKEEIKFNNIVNNINNLNIKMEFLLKEKNNIKKIKTSELNDEKNILNRDIDKYNNLIYEIVNDEKNKIEKHINTLELKKNGYEVEFDNIKKEGIRLRQEIFKLKQCDNDVVKKCPTCKQVLNDNESLLHIEEEKNKHEETLNNLYESGRIIKNKIESISDNISIEQNKINLLYNSKYDNFVEIKDTIKQYKNVIFEIENNINLINNKISNIDDIIYIESNNINSDIIDIEKNVNNLQMDKLVVEKSINELKDIKIRGEKKHIELIELKNKYENRRVLLDNKNNILLKLKDYNIELNDINQKILLYNELILSIEENKKIEHDILIKNKQIEDITIINNENINKKIDINNHINIRYKIIEDINEKISKYNELQYKEYLHNTYINIMHRNGIPTFLLKKSIHIINNELFNLLSNVNFNLYFTDSLDLKLSTKSGEKDEINAVTSSGMERTFCSCALKIALRNINVNSKPDFIFFDEVVNRLVGDSVEQFIILLEHIKRKVNKVIIIEHIHPINYDHIINVIKDRNGISSLEVN